MRNPRALHSISNQLTRVAGLLMRQSLRRPHCDPSLRGHGEASATATIM